VFYEKNVPICSTIEYHQKTNLCSETNLNLGELPTRNRVPKMLFCLQAPKWVDDSVTVIGYLHSYGVIDFRYITQLHSEPC
jgi:hypothetical protein